MWWGVDPLAEKYPEYSPYTYTLNNPIKYIDPDGRVVIIAHKGLSLKYEGGKLLNMDGSLYSGKTNRFIKQAIRSLNRIGKTESGGAMLAELQNSTNEFEIRHYNENPKKDNQFKPDNIGAAYQNQLLTDENATGKERAQEGGSGGVIFWDPSGRELPTTSGIQSNSTSDLGHELFHGLDANRGMLDGRLEDGVSRSEWQAVYRENILRDELNVPYRSHYKSAVDPSGNVLGGMGPLMLENNKPIKPDWYD